MLSALVHFEWRYHTRQASFAAAAGLFLLMGFVLGATGFGADSVRFDSYWMTLESTGLLSLLTLFAVAIFASNAVLRDVEHEMLGIIYATPVGRFHYLFGRFAGVALATMSVATLVVPGMIAGSRMPWANPERLGAFTLGPYLWSLLVLMLPNVILATALIFAIAALTRSSIATYVGAVFAYFLYWVVAALTNSPLMAQSKPGAGGGTGIALLDPFGMSSFFEVTRYWSIAEKSGRFVGLTGTFLANRLIWIGVSAGIFALLYRTFSFRVLRRSRRRAAAIESSTPAAPASVPRRMAVRIAPRWWSTYASATRLEFRALVWNVPFLLLLLLWIGLAVTELHSDLFDAEFRTSLYPTTALIINTLRQPLELFGTLLIVYLSADVFWREERDRIAPIIRATPMPASAMVVSKWSALAGLIAVVTTSGVALGMALQIAKGFPHFEPLVYLSLFYTVALPLALLAAAAALIHAFSPGKYAGMVLVLLFVIYTKMAGSIGLEHPLWQFGRGPSVTYRDMDGLGANATPFAWLMLHWSVVAALLLVIAAVAWRGFRRSTSLQRLSAAGCVMLAVATGGWTFYNTNVLNEYVTQEQFDDWRVVYEKTYRRLALAPQPSVTNIEVALDFYPGEHRYHAAATERLKNRTRTPIGTLWVSIRREAKVVGLSIDGARLTGRDARFGMFRFDFDRPLAPGASTQLHFDVDVSRRGFEAGEQGDPIRTNGTFLMGNRVFPMFGYRSSYELTDARERAKRGLPAREATPEETDTFEASQEPRIVLSSTLSTTGDQTAIGVGRLVRSWNRDGRRFFRYEADAPIANSAVFGSGRYEMTKRRVGDVDVELYLDPKHSQNTGTMLTAAAESLTTFERAFSPYPLGVLRMVEVPRERFAGYASPGIVWFVENRTPMTDVRDPNRLDIATRRVVHEVGHQWFGHQLVPPVAPGASLLVETFAKHCESMMLRRLHGREHLDRFLSMELDRYLADRSNQAREEPPLARVDDEANVYYAKGAVVMNAIEQEIGEPALNQAIRGVLQTPFPHASDFLSQLRNVASPQAYALAEEWLNEIVFYDLAIESANVKRRADGRYDVTLQIRAAKTHADARGNEHAVPMREKIVIGVYADDGTPLQVVRHALHDGSQVVTITVDRVPGRASVDPHVTRTDKNQADNETRL